MTTGEEPQLSQGKAARERGDTLIVLVLDSSGSMAHILDDTIGGYNVYIQNEQASFDADQKYFLSVIFNGNATRIIPPAPISEALPLSRDTYVPASSTPLYDAIGRAIKEAEDYLAGHAEFSSSDGERVFLAIVTDGQENTSHTYTRAHIFDLITEKQRQGWGVVYLGANQDAFVEAGHIGVSAHNTSTFSVNQIRRSMTALNEATGSYRRGMRELIDDATRQELTDEDAN